MRQIASWRTVKLVVRGRLVVPLGRERERVMGVIHQAGYRALNNSHPNTQLWRCLVYSVAITVGGFYLRGKIPMIGMTNMDDMMVVPATEYLSTYLSLSLSLSLSISLSPFLLLSLSLLMKITAGDSISFKAMNNTKGAKH